MLCYKRSECPQEGFFPFVKSKSANRKRLKELYEVMLLIARQFEEDRDNISIFAPKRIIF